MYVPKITLVSASTWLINLGSSFTVSGYFWSIASSIKSGTWCSFVLACLPHFAKQNHNWGSYKLECFFLSFFLLLLLLVFSQFDPKIWWWSSMVFWQYHEGVRAMWLAEKGGNVYRHPYDIGAYENLTTVRTLFSFFSCLKSLIIYFWQILKYLVLISRTPIFFFCYHFFIDKN